MKNKFQGKSIILGVPHHFGLPHCFIKNLEYLGFKVFCVPHDEKAKHRLTWKDKAQHGIKKFLFNNPLHKPEKIAKLQSEAQLKLLHSFPKVDYALVIRPDLFSKTVLQKISEQASFSAGYQWDGMSRFPLVASRIPFFDQFYVFDQEDVKKHTGTQHITNFYFDYLPKSAPIQQDVFFIGTYMKDRMQPLAQLSQILKDENLSLSIKVVCYSQSKTQPYQDTPIQFIPNGESFETALKQSIASNVLIDMENTAHKGLSFRCFEAVGFSKKLITNNALVKNYDFYDKKNIFVLEDSWDIHGLVAFLQEPYQPKPEIAQQYSFSSWISKILAAK